MIKILILKIKINTTIKQEMNRLHLNSIYQVGNEIKVNALYPINVAKYFQQLINISLKLLGETHFTNY